MNPPDYLIRIRRLISELKKLFPGNEKERAHGNARIPELMAACAIARQPLWILGDYGTAKTSMAIEFFERLGLPRGERLGYFETTLHPYSEPSSLFGPLNFRKLTGEEGKECEYERLTHGYLPSVCAAFIDEFINGPQELLLATLSILQHHVYHNGSRREPAPLKIAIVASNDLPAQRQLGALTNRIPLRVIAEKIDDVETRGLVLERSMDLWHAELDHAPDQTRTPVATLEDFAAALAEMRVFQTTNLRDTPFVKAYVRLLKRLADRGDGLVVANARTQSKLYLVMRALALLRRGDPEPRFPELRLLEHIFERPEHQQSIREELNRTAIPSEDRKSQGEEDKKLGEKIPEWEEVPPP